MLKILNEGLVAINTLVCGSLVKDGDIKYLMHFFIVVPLLPVVTLQKYSFDIPLSGWSHYCYCFHKLMGSMPDTFLIAEMTG